MGCKQQSKELCEARIWSWWWTLWSILIFTDPTKKQQISQGAFVRVEIDDKAGSEREQERGEV